MRTLTVHTADELAVRWKRKASDLNAAARTTRTPTEAARLLDVAQAYRVCAAELDAITAVSMELEAAHHGDPEPTDEETATALLEWSQGQRP